MEELKTLKDIEQSQPLLSRNNILLRDLKQEAIKRFKYWSDFKNKQPAGQIVNEMQIEGRLAELIDFFNITEEDLK